MGNVGHEEVEEDVELVQCSAFERNLTTQEKTAEILQGMDSSAG